MEPQEYDNPDGYCPECLDVSLRAWLVWSNWKAQAVRYYCPCCHWTETVMEHQDDAVPIILPPYDDQEA